MARQALSAISVFALLISTSLFSACVRESGTMKSPDNIPRIYKSSADKFFSSVQDTLFYEHKKFSGFTFLLSQKQDIVLLASYKNGLKERRSRKWYKNGQLEEDRFYVQGKKEGLQQGWWPNGTLQFQCTILNDAYEGEYKAWNESGALIKLFHYKHGQEEGSQRLWYNDGKTRANYVIDKGRRFGLLGTKNCRNVTDGIEKK